MCWWERLMASVAILLTTLTISSSSTGSTAQECNIRDTFTSPNIEVFYEEDIAISGCHSSQTVATSKEVHVINLLSVPTSVQPGQRVNVTLNVQQVRTVSQIRGSLIVFVLNSAMPVTWILSVGQHRFALFHYRIEIPQNTSVIYPDDLTVNMNPDINLPPANEDLLESVMNRYTAITTFSAVHGANLINVKIGEDYSTLHSPSICSIQEDFEGSSAVEAYYSQEKPIKGCEIDQTSKRSSVRQVHIIELHSPSHKPIGATPPQVLVDLEPIVRGKTHLYNVVLVLKAHMAVTWNIRSVSVSGRLEILSPNSVEADNVGFHSISQRASTTGMPDMGADLVAWVVSEYGSVASYTEAELANHFVITVKESTDTDGLPLGPKTISGQQALGGPVLATIANVQCHRDSIRVTIPMDIIEYFGLTQENIMLMDPSCEAETIGSDLVLEMGLDECGTRKIVGEENIIYENEVIFSDSDFPEEEGEGSGSSAPDATIGNLPNDEDNQPIEHFPIRCEYLPSGEPVTEAPSSVDQEANMIGNDNYDQVTIYMELFRTTAFLKRVDTFPIVAPCGQRVFFELGLEGSHQLTIMPHHCWISPAGSPYPVVIHELIVDSCPVDPTLIFHNTENYIKLGLKSVKQFSFQVPSTLNPELLDFYVHCELGVCSKDGSGVEHGVPMCASVMPPTGGSCTDIDSTQLLQAPIQSLNVGPLQINRDSLESPDIKEPAANRGDQIIIQGLSAGPAAAVAFAAFAMGVLLTACLWYIHSHTGPRTEPPASPQTVSTPSSPSGNGHILNGHLGHMPNGFLMNGAVGNGYMPNGGINPNRIPAHGMMHGDPNAEEMV